MTFQGFIQSNSLLSYKCSLCGHMLSAKEYDDRLCLKCGAQLDLYEPLVETIK